MRIKKVFHKVCFTHALFSGPGDVNGDKISDIMLGATGVGTGAVYVIYGSATNSLTDINLGQFSSGPQGVRYTGA